MNVDVVIPTKGRWDLLGPLLDSLTGWRRLVILDNGSPEADAEAIARWCDDHVGAEVIPMPGDGIHAMWNRGIRRCVDPHESSLVAILNNDLDVDPGFVEGMAGAFGPRVVMASPNHNDRPSRSVDIVHGLSSSGGVCGWAMFVRSEVFTHLGYEFPEELAWWFGDNDLVATLELAQAPYAVVGHVPVRHVGGGSQTISTITWDRDADEAWFRAKWERILAPRS